MRAGAVGDAQASTEVVRVGDAVENENERRLARRLDGVERVVERMTRGQRLDARDDSLVPIRAGETAQAMRVALDDAHAACQGALDQRAHALVTPARVDMNLDHRGRRGLEAHRHRMESEQNASGHARW